jgi:hypothetical protein
MAPEIRVVQISLKSDRLSSEAVLGILSSFPKKAMVSKFEIILWHTTWKPNLHYLESGRGRYGAAKDGLRIRKILMRLSLWKPSSLVSQGRSHARKGGARLKSSLGYKYNLIGTPRGGSIHPFIRGPLTRRRSTRRKPTAASSPRVS